LGEIGAKSASEEIKVKVTGLTPTAEITVNVFERAPVAASIN